MDQLDVGHEGEGAIQGNALASGCHLGGWWCILSKGGSLEEDQIWEGSRGCDHFESGLG